MTDKALELAEQVSLTCITMNILALQNLPNDPAERVKQDAQFRIAKSAYEKALQDYQGYIAGLTSDELHTLATTPQPTTDTGSR